MTEPRLKFLSCVCHSPSGFITESQLPGDLGHLVTQHFRFTEKTEAQKVKWQEPLAGQYSTGGLSYTIPPPCTHGVTRPHGQGAAQGQCWLELEWEGPE